MNTAQPMLLYGFWRSSASFRVRVALRLKDIPFQEKVVNLEAGEQRSPSYLALNPQGAIPTLLVPGQPPLTQSLAILEWLDEYQPSPPLLPTDPWERAFVRSLAALLTADTHPLVTPRVKGYLSRQQAIADDPWRAWQTHWFHTGLSAFEQRLVNEGRSGNFCLGDTVGIADICLASILAVMAVLKIAPPDGIPLIGKIAGNASTLPAFAEAAPFKQAGAPGI